MNYTKMFTQTQLNEKLKAEFERGFAEGTAAASTKATAEFERGRTEGFAAASSPTPGAPGITKEQEAAMAELKLMRATADDPKVIASKLTAYVAAEAAKGRKIGLSQAAREIENAK